MFTLWHVHLLNLSGWFDLDKFDIPIFFQKEPFCPSTRLNHAWYRIWAGSQRKCVWWNASEFHDQIEDIRIQHNLVGRIGSLYLIYNKVGKLVIITSNLSEANEGNLKDKFLGHAIS